MSLTPGEQLGRYEILSLLGTGSMGEVYRAKDSRLGRDVAIKVLLQEFTSDQDRLKRFEREARAASAMNHPNIVSLYDIGEHEDSPYLVTELLEGETLRHRLDRGALPLESALEVGRQIAKGLAAAHEKGIVHRDLKPENVFLLPDGRIKILDFGLAKLMEGGTACDLLTSTSAVTTEIGVVLGTVAYMSPEQARGKAADHRSDLFSFGALLFEMVAGHTAFHRDTAADTFAAIMEEELPPLSKLGIAVPPALQELLHGLLEKDVDARIQSAEQVVSELEAIARAPVATAAASKGSASRLLILAIGFATLAAILFLIVRSFA
ncbi:MAG TPA: serine/threonine-protein kinase [Planctomycetota bacterium]|nr:serine/threonine-protein kinase [Planctomycetota bacterium]